MPLPMTKEEKARHRAELADLAERYESRLGYGPEQRQVHLWIWVAYLSLLGALLALFFWWT